MLMKLYMMTDLKNRIGDVRRMREEKMSRKLVPPLHCPPILSALLVCTYMRSIHNGKEMA